MLDINIPIAFVAGVFSSLAPCVIPLLPAYVGYAAGMSLKDLRKGKGIYRRKIAYSSLLFILGFSVVFVLLGTAAAGLGQVLRHYDLFIQRVGGLLIMVFGLEFAGYLHIPLLEKSKQFKLPKWLEKLGYAKAFVIGIVFATAWTPCVGAVLGSILTLAAVSTTALYGAVLLFFYSLGISVPFLILALTIASAPRYMKVINKNAVLIARVGGILLAILGLLLLTNTYKYLNSWVFEMFE